MGDRPKTRIIKLRERLNKRLFRFKYCPVGMETAMKTEPMLKYGVKPRHKEGTLGGDMKLDVMNARIYAKTIGWGIKK
jgi:hypothetical protein